MSLAASSMSAENPSLATQAREPPTLRLISRASEHSLEARLARDFNEQRYCDLTIVTRNSSIQAHKAVICSASPAIDRALSGNFQEAQHNTYTIDTEDHGVVWRLIQYCYLSQYSTVDLPSTAPFPLQDQSGIISYRLAPAGDPMHSHNTRLANECNTQRLLLDIDMYRMGDIYAVPSLQLQSLAYLKVRLDALLQEDESAAKAFLEIVKPVYECTGSDDDHLRKMLVLYLRLFGRRFTSREARKRLGELAGEVKEFGMVLVGDYLEVVGRGEGGGLRREVVRMDGWEEEREVGGNR